MYRRVSGKSGQEGEVTNSVEEQALEFMRDELKHLGKSTLKGKKDTNIHSHRGIAI